MTTVIVFFRDIHHALEVGEIACVLVDCKGMGLHDIVLQLRNKLANVSI